MKRPIPNVLNNIINFMLRDGKGNPYAYARTTWIILAAGLSKDGARVSETAGRARTDALGRTLAWATARPRGGAPGWGRVFAASGSPSSAADERRHQCCRPPTTCTGTERGTVLSSGKAAGG